MGHCESYSIKSCKKANKEDNDANSFFSSRKLTERTQGSQGFTQCFSSTNNFDDSSRSNELHTYHCNQISYQISIEELRRCQVFPCNCIKRKDVNLKIFEAEALNNPAKALTCLRHGIHYDIYCFECEIKLCPKCNDCFHNEYFNNHHMFQLQ